MTNTARVSLILLLVLLAVQVASYTQQVYGAPVWTSPTKITDDVNLDASPSILQLQDGRVLMVRDSYKGNTDIFSKIYSSGSGWSPETQLTNNPENDVAPDIAQMANGTVVIAWASERSSNVDIYLGRTDGTSITGERRITTATESDSLTSIVAARNGSIWIFWVRFSTSQSRYDLYYRLVSPNGALGPENLLTPTAALNTQPEATQTKDGKIWLVWSRQVNGFNNEIYSRYYDGASWSSEQQRTNDNESDEAPEIGQDRSGGLWIFWSREFSLGGGMFQDELMYQRSTDGGANWLTEVRLTSDPSGGEKNDREPSVTQGYDKNLWLAYLSDSGDRWDVWLLKYGPVPGRDVGIVYLTPSAYRLTRGGISTISVRVQNYGDDAETVQLEISVRNTTTTRLVSTTLTIQPGQFTVYQYLWNTGTTVPAKYRLSTSLTSIVPGESSTLLSGDNSLQDGIIYVKPPGDVNDDGRVNLLDAGSLSLAYHARPASPNWDPRADIDGNRVVDLADAARLALAFHSRPGMPNWNPAADLDGNSYVDIYDAAILGYAYRSSKGDANWNSMADFNGNSYVDIYDAAILGFWYGTVT